MITLRWFLLFIGWSSVFGSIVDGYLGLFSLWTIASSGWGQVGMSVDELLKQHFEFIYWIKQLAYYLLPKSFVKWLFDLPALVYFPMRIVMSIIIGWWAFSIAQKIDVQKRNIENKL